MAGGCHPAGVYEQPPGRQRIGPALITVFVLLAAGAGTASYFVVKQILADQAVRANRGSERTTPPVTTSRAQPPPQATPTGPQTTPKVTPKPEDPGTRCPAITAKAVSDAGQNADLELLRYVDGTVSGGSGAEAWICKNADGGLYYQGHRKTGPFDAATSDHTILLGPGIVGKVGTEGGDGFIAVNPKDPANPDDPARTEYHVSANAFYFVVQPSGDRTDYVLTRSVG